MDVVENAKRRLFELIAAKAAGRADDATTPVTLVVIEMTVDGQSFRGFSEIEARAFLVDWKVCERRVAEEFRPAIVVERPGDLAWWVFLSAEDAVQSALALQRRLLTLVAAQDPGPACVFPRIGMHLAGLQPRRLHAAWDSSMAEGTFEGLLHVAGHISRCAYSGRTMLTEAVYRALPADLRRRAISRGNVKPRRLEGELGTYEIATAADELG